MDNIVVDEMMVLMQDLELLVDKDSLLVVAYNFVDYLNFHLMDELFEYMDQDSIEKLNSFCFKENWIRLIPFLEEWVQEQMEAPANKPIDNMFDNHLALLDSYTNEKIFRFKLKIKLNYRLIHPWCTKWSLRSDWYLKF